MPRGLVLTTNGTSVPAGQGIPAGNITRNNPAKLTPEVVDAIVESSRNGLPFTRACVLAGVSKHVPQDWSYTYKYHRDICPPVLVDMFERIEMAQAELQDECLGNLREAAAAEHRHWTASAWILERRFPEEYGRHQDVRVTHDGDAPRVQVNQVVLADPGAREASRDLLRRVTSFGADVALRSGMGGEPERPEEGSA